MLHIAWKLDDQCMSFLTRIKNISDGYKTEDEVVFSHPTKINRNADRLISTAQVNPQKIEELSKSVLNSTLHSRTLDRTNCPSG